MSGSNKEPPRMTLGDRIRKAREARGWSQAELAKAVGISQPAIRKIESGQTSRSRHLFEVLSALGIGFESMAPAPSRPDEVFEPGVAPVVPSQAQPLEVMLEEMRFHHTIARNDPDRQRAAGHLHRAFRAAKDAAPYAYAKHLTPPAEQAGDAKAGRRAGMSELEAARQLVFLLERGARGMLEGQDGGKTKATDGGRPNSDVDE